MTELLKISLPDGSVREMEPGTTPADVAAAIGPGLAKAAIAARVDGELRVEHAARDLTATDDLRSERTAAAAAGDGRPGRKGMTPMPTALLQAMPVTSFNQETPQA